MPVSIGYTTPTLSTLTALSTSELITGYSLFVISQLSWYTYDSASTTSIIPLEILSPDTGTGRWIRQFSSVPDSYITDSKISNTANISQSKINNLTNDLNSKANSIHTHSVSNLTDFNEGVDDRVNALLIAGSNITLNYNDVNNTLTINSTASGGSSITDEQIQDVIGNILTDSSTIDFIYNDTANTITANLIANSIGDSLISSVSSSKISDFTEAVDDEVNTLLQAGTNITLSYDDIANRLTINSTASGGGGGLTYTPIIGVSSITPTSNTFYLCSYTDPNNAPGKQLFNLPTSPTVGLNYGFTQRVAKKVWLRIPTGQRFKGDVIPAGVDGYINIQSIYDNHQVVFAGSTIGWICTPNTNYSYLQSSNVPLGDYSVFQSSIYASNNIYQGTFSILNDNNINTFVATNGGANSFVGFDFGEQITINSIRITGGNAAGWGDLFTYFGNCTLQSSNDNVTWTTQFENLYWDSTRFPTILHYRFLPITARFFRFFSANGSLLSLADLVFDNETANTNFWTYTTTQSSTYLNDSTYTASFAKLTDGNVSTGGATDAGTNSFIRLDLGQDRLIRGFIFRNNTVPGFGDGFQTNLIVESSLSATPTSFTNRFTMPGFSTRNLMPLTSTFTARYIRFRQPTSGSYASLSEVFVF